MMVGLLSNGFLFDRTSIHKFEVIEIFDYRMRPGPFDNCQSVHARVRIQTHVKEFSHLTVKISRFFERLFSGTLIEVVSLRWSITCNLLTLWHIYHFSREMCNPNA